MNRKQCVHRHILDDDKASPKIKLTMKASSSVSLVRPLVDQRLCLSWSYLCYCKSAALHRLAHIYFFGTFFFVFALMFVLKFICTPYLFKPKPPSEKTSRARKEKNITTWWEKKLNTRGKHFSNIQQEIGWKNF